MILIREDNFSVEGFDFVIPNDYSIFTPLTMHASHLLLLLFVPFRLDLTPFLLYLFDQRSKLHLDNKPVTYFVNCFFSFLFGKLTVIFCPKIVIESGWNLDSRKE